MERSSRSIACPMRPCFRLTSPSRKRAMSSTSAMEGCRRSIADVQVPSPSRRRHGVRRKTMRLTLFIALLAPIAAAQTLSINEGRPLFADTIPFTITGTAPPNSEVIVTLSSGGHAPSPIQSNATGTWSLTWTTPLKTGTYDITATSAGTSITQILRVQLAGNLQRQSGIEAPPPRYAPIEPPNPDAAMEMTDRWRIVPPPYELDEHSRGRWDPYNKNIYKGDYPWRPCHPEGMPRAERSAGSCDWFLVLTGVSDTLAESRTLPTPSGVSSVRPSSFRFFGNLDSNRYQYNAAIFDRLEKDTNSGLNIFHERRDQQVAIANLYWQDFLRKGYTQEFSVHFLHDAASTKYDRNGFLVRPAPIGDFQPHSIRAVYLGESGLGHI